MKGSPTKDRNSNLGKICCNGHLGNPLTYNFANLSLIAQDVEKRNYFYRKTASLLERKAQIDLNYASLLQSVLNKDFIRATDSNLPSQTLYSKLVGILQQQPRRMRLRADLMREQAERMNGVMQDESLELKRALEGAQKISKQILHQKQKTQKSKLKYSKKNKELEMLRIEYIAGVLGNQQLQKTNNLYLSMHEMENSVQPLMEDYRHMAGRFNDTVGKMVDQLNSCLYTIEQVESHKIKNIKAAVTKYVKTTKNNLDQVLEKYPFICQELDRTRDKQQFVPHSCQNLINQLQDLDSSLSFSHDYLDSIYERIEVKKNLEDIILYGQEPEHKRLLHQPTSTSPSTESEQPQPFLEAKTLRMTGLFRDIFQGHSTPQHMGQLRSLFRGDQRLRKDFILCMQQFRLNSEFELNSNNKDTIITCVNGFLDVCHQQLDTYNSKMLMVLSLTYYFTQGEEKVELQELIREHPIWTHIQWWQAALLQTIYQETRIKSKLKESPIRIWDIKAGGLNRKEEGEEETYQYICFNQLLFFVRNMGLFRISPIQIVEYAKINIAVLKFTGKFVKDILDLCPQSPILQKHAQSSP